jgi:hypothetical protein
MKLPECDIWQGVQKPDAQNLGLFARGYVGLCS